MFIYNAASVGVTVNLTLFALLIAVISLSLFFPLFESAICTNGNTKSI